MQERIAATIGMLSGYKMVGIASSIVEAGNKIGAQKPDIILLDVGDQLQNISSGIAVVQRAIPEGAIIATSKRWDEGEARQALQAGAKGYLAKPFSGKELTDAVAAMGRSFLRNQSEHGLQGKIISVFSPKGGHGVSSLTLNVAVGLAEETDGPVGIIDANLQFGDMAIFCNLSPASSIFEVTRDLNYLSPLSMGTYFTEYNHNIRVLAAPLRPEQADLVRGESVTRILEMARSLFAYVIVDTPPGFNEISLAIADAADLVYVVCALNTGREVVHAHKCLEFFKRLGYSQNKVRMVFNRAQRRDLATLNSLEKELSYPVTTLLTNDFNLAVTAANRGQSMIAIDPTAELVRGYLDIVRDITLEEIEEY